MIKQQAARCGPGNGNLDADVRCDPENAGAIARIDNHIFVAAQRAELRRRRGLHGKPVKRFAAAAVQGIGIGIGAAIEMGRLAKINRALVADLLQGCPLRSSGW